MPKTPDITRTQRPSYDDRYREEVLALSEEMLREYQRWIGHTDYTRVTPVTYTATVTEKQMLPMLPPKTRLVLRETSVEHQYVLTAAHDAAVTHARSVGKLSDEGRKLADDAFMVLLAKLSRGRKLNSQQTGEGVTITEDDPEQWEFHEPLSERYKNSEHPDGIIPIDGDHTDKLGCIFVPAGAENNITRDKKYGHITFVFLNNYTAAQRKRHFGGAEVTEEEFLFKKMQMLIGSPISQADGAPREARSWTIHGTQHPQFIRKMYIAFMVAYHIAYNDQTVNRTGEFKDPPVQVPPGFEKLVQDEKTQKEIRDRLQKYNPEIAARLQAAKESVLLRSDFASIVDTQSDKTFSHEAGRTCDWEALEALQKQKEKPMTQSQAMKIAKQRQEAHHTNALSIAQQAALIRFKQDKEQFKEHFGTKTPAMLQTLAIRYANLSMGYEFDTAHEDAYIQSIFVEAKELFFRAAFHDFRLEEDISPWTTQVSQNAIEDIAAILTEARKGRAEFTRALQEDPNLHLREAKQRIIKAQIDVETAHRKTVMRSRQQEAGDMLVGFNLSRRLKDMRDSTKPSQPSSPDNTLLNEPEVALEDNGAGMGGTPPTP